VANRKCLKYVGCLHSFYKKVSFKFPEKKRHFNSFGRLLYTKWKVTAFRHLLLLLLPVLVFGVITRRKAIIFLSYKTLKVLLVCDYDMTRPVDWGKVPTRFRGSQESSVCLTRFSQVLLFLFLLSCVLFFVALSCFSSELLWIIFPLRRQQLSSKEFTHNSGTSLYIIFWLLYIKNQVFKNV